MDDKPLTGKTIALAETRQLDQLAGMLERKGGSVIRCPMVSIVDNPDEDSITAWISDFIDNECHLLILFTGEGLRRLLGFAERAGLKDRFVDALQKTKKLTRGPKPARALKEIGLAPDLTAAQPTTEGILQTLAGLNLQGQRVALQLYSPDQDRRVTEYLRAAGALVREVAPYQYASHADKDQVLHLIGQVDAGKVDVIAFTSASQVDRLHEVAKDGQLEEALRRGLERTKVAAVGPVVAARLEELGARVDVVPEENFFMAPLVTAIVAAVAQTT